MKGKKEEFVLESLMYISTHALFCVHCFSFFNSSVFHGPDTTIQVLILIL